MAFPVVSYVLTEHFKAVGMDDPSDERSTFSNFVLVVPLDGGFFPFVAKIKNGLSPKLAISFL